MRLIRSVFVLRRKDRLQAKLAIHEERMLRRALPFMVGPVYTAFAFVDALLIGFQYLAFFLVLRFATVFFAQTLYLLLRGRVRNITRYFCIFFPYMLVVQGIMLFGNLQSSGYLAGLTLILFTGISLSTIQPKWSLIVYPISLLPTTLFFIFSIAQDPIPNVLGLLMTIGTIALAILNNARTRDDMITRLRATLALDQDVKNREKEIREKAAELVKRKRFESQFSPQVVARVLGNISNYDKLNTENICTIVIDIKDSSSKSDSLNPMAYAEVIEEVFDIIAAGCLKWNITVDKFTGDGAQAFAGSPEKRPDDLKRSVEACGEIVRMLQARQDYLSLRWQGRVELRFGICEGTALVGFLGKGAMRSFTAIGNNVSLTHRICAESKPGSIFIHCSSSQEEQFSGGTFIKKKFTLKNLKGFEGRTFNVLELTPRFVQSELKDIGRCPDCSTPLVLIEDTRGIPKVTCPACANQTDDKSKIATDRLN